MTKLQIPMRRFTQEDVTVALDLNDILEIPEEYADFNEWLSENQDEAYKAVYKALRKNEDMLIELGYSENVETRDCEYTDIEVYWEDWEHE